MKLLRLTLVSAALVPGLGLLAETDASGEPSLFAAMIMTKQQQASSVPTDSGVLLRPPESEAWLRLGPAIQMISSATADPSDPSTVFLAAGNGVVRSTDGGHSWRLVTGWRESDVLQLAIDPTDGDHVYGASAWGVIVSRDGGDSWEYANEGLTEFYAKGIVLDARNPRRLLLASTTGLFESPADAIRWKRVASFPPVAVLRLRQGDGAPKIWIAGTEGQGVWLSRNNGRTWRATAPALAEANIYGVAIDPTDGSRLAAGGWGTGVHLSTDGGRSWARAEGTLPSSNLTAMTFDPRHPGRLWASTFEEGTFFSDDGGRNWTSAALDGAYVFDLGFLSPKATTGAEAERR
ncbi:MAG: WD40/YVTN/BNR-like repeat-containing protein [Opitutales bacterium]